MTERTATYALCDVLGIRYPIVQAPMNWVTNAQFVAAVSNAGALGVLGPNAGATTISRDPDVVAKRLADQIDLVRELTADSFAVNYPIGLASDRRFSDRCVEVGVNRRIPIALTSLGSPEIYTAAFKRAGIKVIHTVASVRQGLKAQAAGVDAVICQGAEAGGHLGVLELSNIVLVPALDRELRVPIIAAGGVTNVAGCRAMTLLGASGVCLGTRFLATVESPVHPNLKRAMVEADENSLAIWGRGWSLTRGLKNRFIEKVLNEDTATKSREVHARLSETYDRFGSGVNRVLGGMIYGDLDEGEIYLGQGVTLIERVETVQKVVNSLARGFAIA